MSSAALKAVATRTAAPEQTGAQLLQGLLDRPFDADAYHAMNERDNQLIRDEVLHGASSKAFVYEFKMEGGMVSGVSVVGARELASQYKGIKSRIVATIEKRRGMFIFRTFTPLSIVVNHIPELEDEDDFYEVVLEVSDIKTGNSIEVRKKETRLEKRRNGEGYFERKHHDVIAESKAFRNGVLNLLPQSVVQAFKARALAAGNSSTEQTLDQIRAGALAFAAKHAVPINRAALNDLTYAEINGLGGAAKLGLDEFKKAAQALNLAAGAEAAAAPAQAPAPAPTAAKKTSKGAPKGEAAAPPPDSGAPAKKTFADYVEMVESAGSAEDAGVFMDQATAALGEKDIEALAQVYAKKWGGQ